MAKSTTKKSSKKKTSKKITSKVSSRLKRGGSNQPKKPPKLNISHELHSKFLKRIALYTFFAFLTLSLTFLVYYRSKGYTFTKSGQVERRGIVLIDSAPLGSTVYFDDRKIEKTQVKIEASEGAHKVRLEAESYRTWQHSFNMRAETVKWYYYPYLIPTQIPSEPYLSNQIPKLYSPKAESKNLLVALHIAEPGPTFELLNLNNNPEQALSLISTPAELFTKNSSGTYGTFNFIEWSPDSDSLLIEHQFDQTSELINLRVNNPEQSANLTRTLATPITKAHFNPASKLNLLIGGELRQYNPTNLALEQTIAANLTSFKSFENQIHLYTKTSLTEPETSELYLQQGQNSPILITKLNSLDSATFDYSYTVNRRSGYLAVTNILHKEIQVFKNPLQNPLVQDEKLSAKPALYLATFAELKSPELKISPAGSSQPGRYLALQLSNSRFFIYNFDTEETLSYDLKITSKSEQVEEQNNVQNIGKELNISKFAWLDSHRLQVQDVSGDIYYLDYDGNYLNLIASGGPRGLSSFVRSKAYSIVVTNSNDGSNTQNLTKLKFKLE